VEAREHGEGKVMSKLFLANDSYDVHYRDCVQRGKKEWEHWLVDHPTYSICNLHYADASDHCGQFRKKLVAIFQLIHLFKLVAIKTTTITPAIPSKRWNISSTLPGLFGKRYFMLVYFLNFAGLMISNNAAMKNAVRNMNISAYSSICMLVLYALVRRRAS
jgi:hypothetical protein